MKENHFVINFRKKDENTKNTLLLLTRNNCASLFADKNFKFLTHNVFAINFVGVLMEKSPFEQNYLNYLLIPCLSPPGIIISDFLLTENE